MIRHRLALILLALTLIGVTACGSAGTAASTAGSSAAPIQITVKGNEFKFDPNQVAWKANQPVQLVFQNTGNLDHELDLSAMPAENVQVDLGQAGNIPATAKNAVQQDAQAGKVHVYAGPGKAATVTFTPTQAGTYQFVCNVPGHKEAGMVGTATVQP